MEKAYTVEEIQTIEKKEFKRLKSSYTLMNRAGTNCAKKISKLDLKKILSFYVDREITEVTA